MRATLLGTGSALPSPDRVQAGVLVEDDGDRLLVDCGSGVLHRLAGAGIDHGTVDTVLLTHLHLDHVADLPGLVKARVLTDRPDLTVVGPPGTGLVLRDLLAIDDLHERARLAVREVTAERFEAGGFEVRARETRHSRQCFAYRFGSALAISGDTAPFPELVEFFDGVDALIHECSYPDGTDAAGHTTPSELGRLLEGRDVDRVYLTHLFPAAERSSEELRAAVGRRFDGEVVVATDGLAVSA